MSENPWCYLDAPALDKLDLASILVRAVLDATPYLVGSCLVRADYRDVDIRVILTDERFDTLFPAHPRRDPLQHLIQRAITEHYVTTTGLPRIDFQIQRMIDANEKYPTGHRQPLGTYPARQ